MWYRVFCRTANEPSPATLIERAQQIVPNATGHFRGDDLGWTAAELTLGSGTPVFVERYLVREDNLRADLNTWAAWLETLTYSPSNTILMERVIQSQQLITIRRPLDHSNESAIEDLCRALGLSLAALCDGVLQIEGDGWYSSGGSLMLPEY